MKTLGIIIISALLGASLANHPFIFGLVVYLGIGYLVDAFACKISYREYYYLNKSYDFGTSPGELLGRFFFHYLLPPIGFLMAVTMYSKNIRREYPCVPKFRSPFYYDNEKQ